MSDGRSGPPDSPTKSPPAMRASRPRSAVDISGPETGRMTDHHAWAMARVKAAHEERKAASRPGQAPAQPAGGPAAKAPAEPQQSQGAPRKLVPFEERHGQALARSGQGPTPDHPYRDSQAKKPDQYKTLKRFEDRHPSGQDHTPRR